VPTGLIEDRKKSPETPVAEKTRRFISAYWLRPENAFWMVLRSNALDRVPIRGPMLDLSCGDGVFSFLHAGGRFAPDFDVFESTHRLDEANATHADIFDHVDESYQPAIARPADYSFDYGTDSKKTSLMRASRLDFYDRLTLHDNNHRLPFDDDAFQTVYCNSAYWVDRVDDFLAEVFRVTAPGGSIVMQVKLDSIRQFTLETHRDVLGDRFLSLINRGRFDSWPTLCGRTTWESRFESANLETLDAESFVTGTHAHVWDIGLRPVAPLLIKAMNAIHTPLRNEIKRDWVDLFCDLLKPFCQSELELFCHDSEPVEIQYVLTPRK
jgi:SAM-dependent methyltransferase